MTTPMGSTGPVVHTATGPVPAAELGFVLPHEHLVWAEAGWQYDTGPRLTRAQQLDCAQQMLREAAATGVSSVIDPTTPEMGRDVDLMAEASAATGVRVVFATGLYSRWPTPYFMHCTAGELAEHFVTELTDGVGLRRARPAFVKVAVEDAVFSAHEATVLEAAAAAHERLDTPILVHCQAGAALPVLERLVDDLGVDGTAIVVGHAESDADLGHHLRIVEGYGATVGFDRFGLSVLGTTDDVRVGLVTALCGRGHAGRIHLSHDYAGCNQGRGARRLAERRAALHDWRVGHLGRVILPRLRAAGLDETVLRTMTRTAPAGWLARTDVPAATAEMVAP